MAAQDLGDVDRLGELFARTSLTKVKLLLSVMLLGVHSAFMLDR